MSTSTLVNGQPAELGCYIDGHWGQYGPDRLAEIAEGFGWNPLEHQDPRALRDQASAAEDQEFALVAQGWTPPPNVPSYALWEAHTGAADEIERWLNEHTPDGHIWHWHDGEFFLSSICDDPDECEDETCAHWD